MLAAHFLEMSDASFVVKNGNSIFINRPRDALKRILHIFKSHFY